MGRGQDQDNKGGSSGNRSSGNNMGNRGSSSSDR
jgi:hypothetical protein